jgi:actin-like ATPase involved in cell morphogenesis
MGILNSLFRKKGSIKKVKGYIMVGATIQLDEKGVNYYIGTATEQIEKSNKSFRKLINAKNMPASVGNVKVEGNARSNVDDIVDRVMEKLSEWQPELRKFNFGENHFYCGGYGKIQSTNQEFNWAVIFHFE